VKNKIERVPIIDDTNDKPKEKENKIFWYSTSEQEATGYTKHEAILKPKPAKPQHTPDPIPTDYPDITPDNPNL